MTIDTMDQVNKLAQENKNWVLVGHQIPYNFYFGFDMFSFSLSFYLSHNNPGKEF